jgi:hypothetical protein
VSGRFRGKIRILCMAISFNKGESRESDSNTYVFCNSGSWFMVAMNSRIVVLLAVNPKFLRMVQQNASGPDVKCIASTCDTYSAYGMLTRDAGTEPWRSRKLSRFHLRTYRSHVEHYSITHASTCMHTTLKRTICACDSIQGLHEQTGEKGGVRGSNPNRGMSIHKLTVLVVVADQHWSLWLQVFHQKLLRRQT